jgi:hypothetical protein
MVHLQLLHAVEKYVQGDAQKIMSDNYIGVSFVNCNWAKK